MTAASVRVALVTGASGGIGRAIAAGLREAGLACAGVATRAERLEGVALDLRRACDVTDPAAVHRLVEGVVGELGRLDVVVNAAGVAGSNRLDAPPGRDDELWHRIVDVNLNGPYYVCKAAIPHLPDETGRIINVGSVLSLLGVPDQTAYSAAKHGLLGLTRALAMYLAPRRITVNALAPGWTDTPMAEQRWRELDMTREDAARGIPIGRVITPADVAAWAVFLAGPASGAVTGQVIPIDGGTLQH